MHYLLHVIGRVRLQLVDYIEYVVLLFANLLLFLLNLMRLTKGVRYGRQKQHFTLLRLRHLLIQE